MMTIDDMLSQVAKITGKALNEKPVTNAVKAQSKETVKSDLTVKPVFNGIADKKTLKCSNNCCKLSKDMIVLFC